MRRQAVALLVGAGLAVTVPACASPVGAQSTPATEPVSVETPAGSDLAVVTLTPRAIERAAVRTTEVRALGRSRLVVPYSAVLYDPHGQPWVYTSPEPRSFVRHEISVVSIDGNVAVLSDGPSPGTAVVAVGAAELYGSELGVDH